MLEKWLKKTVHKLFGRRHGHFGPYDGHHVKRYGSSGKHGGYYPHDHRGSSYYKNMFGKHSSS